MLNDRSRGRRRRLIRLDGKGGDAIRFPPRLLGVLALVFATAIGGLAVVGTQTAVLGVQEGRGWIEPANSQTVRAPMAGLVSAVLVDPGAHVAHDQPLLQLDTRHLSIQAAEIAHEIRVARLDLLRRQAERNEALERTSFELDGARLDLLDARNQLRQQGLAFRGREINVDSLLGSYQPESHIGLDAAVNDIRRIEQRMNLLRVQERLLLSDSTVELEVRERLRHLSTRLADAEYQVERTLVRAPMAGVVGTPDLRELMGQAVSDGAPLLEIADPAAWRARIVVPATGVHRIRLGDSVRVTVEPLAGVLETPLNATVDYVGAPTSESTGVAESFLVLATVSDSLTSTVQTSLRRGFVVTADIVTGRVSLLGLLRQWTGRMLGVPTLR